MDFGQLKPQVYRILEDPGEFAWPNSALALHLQDAVRNVANQLGQAAGRVTLSLVAGTAEYLLPQGVRRIKSLRILPAIQAGGTQADAGPPLEQSNSLAEFPVISVQDAEPCKYVMSMVAGANEDQFQVILYPTPDRSATDAIIIDIDNEYPFTSNDPSDPTDDAQLIPFPPQYDKVIMYMTAGGMLSERTDQSDVEKGEYFAGKAEQILQPMLPVKSTQAYAHRPRAFP